ncbi:hypothetical protein SDC9_212817 [bioreactor metagenome]|uniref:Uncharacterized protein n=1 Tax=bioreactor metagenome TaxID=1076179 RepID=A0A645JN02_9ZZZZ
MLFHFVIHKGHAGDNEAGAALCTLGVIVDAALVKAALGVAKAKRPHRCHRKAVFDGTATDGDRLEQDRILFFQKGPSSSN